MKKNLLFSIIIMLATTSCLDKPTKIIFFGDSITQLGVEPTGYISKIKEMLTADGKADNYDLIGSGVSGNKVYDLYFRFEKDVLDQHPDVVVIFVGVNDVWHKRAFGTGTDLDKFVTFYSAMIEKLQSKKIKVVLTTPACIGEKTNYGNEQDGDLYQYAQSIRDLAKKYSCPLCDLRQAFLDYNLQHNKSNLDKGILTVDGVHFNDAGNLLAAGQFYSIITQF